MLQRASSRSSLTLESTRSSSKYYYYSPSTAFNAGALHRHFYDYTMTKKALLLIIAAAVLAAGCSQKLESIDSLADRVFELAKTQTALMDGQLDETHFPKTIGKEGEFVTSNIDWWCSGFFPGSLWYIYEYTGDDAVKDLALKNTLKLGGLLERHTDHDIGFQINCSYGNAYRLTGNQDFIPVIERAAEKLSERYSPVTNAIQSWDRRRGWLFPVIIDNMMNLELLMNASELTGRGEFNALALSHANTTLMNHFRPDATCYHLVDYDPEDGHVRGRCTVQGFADESVWARGQAWAFYGYTMMYSRCEAPHYGNLVHSMAGWLLANLPEDGVPYWDFAEDRSYPELRDASAGAIMASAFAQLSLITEDPEAAAAYKAMAEKQVRTLASEEYLSAPGENCGFILKHSVGNIPGGTEIDVPLTYADYYFLEALMYLTGKLG